MSCPPAITSSDQKYIKRNEEARWEAQRLHLGSPVDTRHYLPTNYQYGTYTFEKDDGKEGGVTTKTVTFERGGPTTQSVRL